MVSNKTYLLQQTLSELKAFFTVHKASHYYIAASGGLDSMLLTTLAIELKLPITLLHVNYGLRGAESDGDQAFLEAYCREFKIELLVKKVALKEVLQKHNLQAEARRIRYAFFEEVRRRQPDSFICTAHHAADQVETFWLQLARGAGLKGLAGMQQAQNRLLRPLLHLERAQMLQLAQLLDINFRQDSSNASLKYRRNYWRHELLPFIRQQLPQIDQNVAQIQKSFAQEIRHQVEGLEAAKLSFNLNKSISLIELSKLTAYQFIELFKYLETPNYVIKRISDLFNAENGKFLTWKKPDAPFKHYLIKTQHVISYFSDQPIEWIFEMKSNKTNEEIELMLDQDKLIGDLYFRTIQSSDKLKVKGMKGSKKALQILKEAGIPAPLRKNYQLLCDQQKIIAMPGYYINELVLAQENTIQPLRVRISKKP